MFDRPVIEAIRRHALAEHPREACGVVVAGEYRPCANVHAAPDDNGLIAPAEMAAAIADGLQAVVHSHPRRPEDPGWMDFPTATDMVSQVAAAVPFGLVCSDGQVATMPVWWGDQVEMPPLIGRGFRHGVTDCLSLIRDIFRLPRAEVERQLGIADWPFDGVPIKEFPRDWEWWLQEGDRNPHFYRDCFAAAGFVEVDDGPRTGDVFRVSLRSPTPNHAGIYLGRGMALHHLTSRLPVDPTRLSKREPIGKWAGMIQEYKWLRYRG